MFGQSSIVKVKAIVVDEIDRDNPPHALLVGALVWPTFATGFLETGAIGEEVGVTRRGIDELGESYLVNAATGEPSPVNDDTSMRIGVTGKLLGQGRVADGVTMLHGVLQNRTHSTSGSTMRARAWIEMSSRLSACVAAFDCSPNFVLSYTT